LRAVREVARGEHLLPIEEARSPYEPILNAIRPGLPICNLEPEDILALAADTGCTIAWHAMSDRLVSSLHRYQESNRL